MKYPKLQTLFKRDEKRNMVIMPDHISKPEFSLIKYWEVTEKIDGTNIRVNFELQDATTGYKIEFGGRTDKAIIPTYLLESLEKTFTVQNMHKAFVKLDGEEPKLPRKVILFGEGFGPKIQSVGKNYSKDHSFVLFDVWIDGWWLEQDSVADIAKRLGIKSVPSFGIMSTDEIIEFVKRQRKSLFAKEKDMIMEGVVVRSAPMVLFRDGKPVMWKLKCNDFNKLQKQLIKDENSNHRE